MQQYSLAFQSNIWMNQKSFEMAAIGKMKVETYGCKAVHHVWWKDKNHILARTTHTNW